MAHIGHERAHKEEGAERDARRPGVDEPQQGEKGQHGVGYLVDVVRERTVRDSPRGRYR